MGCVEVHKSLFTEGWPWFFLCVRGCNELYELFGLVPVADEVVGNPDDRHLIVVECFEHLTKFVLSVGGEFNLVDL